MTLHPLDFDFPLSTPPIARGEGKPPLILSRRAPWTVPIADQCSEVAREIETRREFYPKQVATGRMKQTEADRHIALLDDIHCDLTGFGDAPVARSRWDPKVRELRREIATRRSAFPRFIEQARLREADAAPRMEALEAVHFTYWIRLDFWDEPGDRATLSALLDPVRRQAGLVEAWLWRAHQSADPAVAGYLTPEQIAWHQAKDQQARKAA